MAENKLLGEILIEMGVTTREMVVECLSKQTEIHLGGIGRMPLGQLLLKTGYVSAEQLERALAKQSRYKRAN